MLLRSPMWDYRNPFNSFTIMSYFFISMSLKMPGLMILNTPLTISVSLKFSEASVHLSAYNIIRDVRRVVTNLASVYLELTWLDTWESPQGESKVMSYMSGLFSLVLMLCGSTLLYCRLGKVSVLCGCCHILVYFPAKCFIFCKHFTYICACSRCRSLNTP